MHAPSLSSSGALPRGPKSVSDATGPNPNSTSYPKPVPPVFLSQDAITTLSSRPTPGAPQRLLLLPIHGPRVCRLPPNISLFSPVLSSHPEPACSPLVHPLLYDSTCSLRQQKEDSGFEPQPSPSHPPWECGEGSNSVTHLTCSLQDEQHDSHQVKIKLALPARNSTSCSRRDRSCRCQLRVQEGLEWGREAPAHLLEALSENEDREVYSEEWEKSSNIFLSDFYFLSQRDSGSHWTTLP